MTSINKTSPAPAIEQEARFQWLFHHHPLPMWVVVAGTLQFLAVNESTIRLYGFSRKEFLGMTMDQTWRPTLGRPNRIASRRRAAYPVTRWRYRRKDGGILDRNAPGEIPLAAAMPCRPHHRPHPGAPRRTAQSRTGAHARSCLRRHPRARSQAPRALLEPRRRAALRLTAGKYRQPVTERYRDGRAF